MSIIRVLDSAFPPNKTQIAEAKAAGYGGWLGYFAGPNILNGWSDQNFLDVLEGGLGTGAYCSGWADATACKTRATALGIRPILDDESGIRSLKAAGSVERTTTSNRTLARSMLHGGQARPVLEFVSGLWRISAWVQPWLDASGGALYGNQPVFAGAHAAAYVFAGYPGGDPGVSWPSYYPRPTDGHPCGWQFEGTHVVFGIGVDASNFDDTFFGLHGGGGGQVVGPIPTGGKMLTFRPGDPTHRYDLAWLLNGSVWRSWGSSFDLLWATNHPAGSTEVPDLAAVVPGIKVAEIIGFAWNQDGSLCCLAVVGTDGLLYGQQIDINGGSSGWRRLGATGSASLAASLPASAPPDDDSAYATKTYVDTTVGNAVSSIKIPTTATIHDTKVDLS